MSVLLYAPATSPRLQYICQFIFKEIMGVDFLISVDLEEFTNNVGVKIKYQKDTVTDEQFSIGDCGLLFETNIGQKDIECFDLNNFKAFFKTENADLAFDIFAASFYLLSRYEEYLPHKRDAYGRYAHQNSLAFKEGFLHLPLINIWIKHFIEILQTRFPGFTTHQSAFSCLPTYDIDIAFSYQHKGWVRNAAGFIKSPSFERFKVLFGVDKDPFDCYEWLNELHDQFNIQPLYFFLLAKSNGLYDKNILPHKKAMWKLVQQHAKKYTIGIHPSWQSVDNPALLTGEKEQLAAMSGALPTKSRQHYIRFNLPNSYRQLLGAGIIDDYSMGYGSVNGFRASVASTFYWFDLQKNEPTLLCVHPFCYMDANSYYEQGYTPAAAYKELVKYASICKEVGGQMILIWHNNFLGTTPQLSEWKAVYKQFIVEVSKSGDFNQNS